MVMIIECKQCGSKFKLDEGLLREEGSKVKCSVCKSVFRAYPKGIVPKGTEEPKVADQSLGETVTLDTYPTLEEERPEPLLEDSFEAELAKALQEESETKRIETISPDQIPEEEEEELRFDFEEGIKSEPKPGAAPSSTLQREITKIAEELPKPEKAVPKKRKKGGLPRFLMILLIVVLLLTGGVAALLYFAPEQVPEYLTSYLGVAGKPEVKDPGVRRLSFKNVSGKFYQSSKAGNLFCVQGMVFNEYPGSRSFIRIKGSLLDEKGVAVKQKMAYAGNTYTENELKDMTLEQINQGLANRTGRGNANVNVKAKTLVPFMIVFEELPDNLSEFTVEAVASSPGQ
jgi:pilus assembly protein FimV